VKLNNSAISVTAACFVGRGFAVGYALPWVHMHAGRHGEKGTAKVLLAHFS